MNENNVNINVENEEVKRFTFNLPKSITKTFNTHFNLDAVRTYLNKK